MKPIKYSLTKQIVNELEEKISSGEYEVGSKIPTEPELIELFGVSRNTLREAVQALIHAGLLEARQGDGTYVIAKEKFQVELFNFLGKTQKQEIEEVRKFLEEYIVTSAINNATEDDLHNIEHCLNQRNVSADTIKENTILDMNFHTAIALATHNTILINMYQYVSQYFNEYIAEKLSYETNEPEYIDNLHTKLYLAIKNKDSIEAKEIILKIIEI